MQITLHALLKNPGKYFVIVSLALRVIDANCVIQTQFVRMEANVRLGWADVIVHRDFMGRYVKWDSVIHMVPVSMTAHALVTCKDPIVNANLLSQVKNSPTEFSNLLSAIFMQGICKGAFVLELAYSWKVS